MKRRDTTYLQGDLLKLIDSFALSRNLSITDDSTQQQLLDELAKALSHSRNNPIRLHGFRIQSMFAYVAAALGGCRLINEEDSGIFFDDGSATSRADFRLVTLEGAQFLVEVKNNHGKNQAPYRVTKKYFKAVTDYAAVMGIPLKFAVYWSRLNIWTLVDSDRFENISGRMELPFLAAIKMNEMNCLGDSMICTIPPLTLRATADFSGTRPEHPDGSPEAPAPTITLYAGGKEITEADEMALAWFFIRYSKWTNRETRSAGDDDRKRSFEISFSPEVPVKGQIFDILGSMSQMISQQYRSETADGPTINSISPSSEAEQLGVIIPRDYEGKALHLWRLSVQPSFGNPEDEGPSAASPHQPPNPQHRHHA